MFSLQIRHLIMKTNANMKLLAISFVREGFPDVAV